MRKAGYVVDEVGSDFGSSLNMQARSTLTISLPFELLPQSIGEMTTALSDKASLALVSKQFHQAFIPILYASVHLERPVKG